MAPRCALLLLTMLLSSTLHAGDKPGLFGSAFEARRSFLPTFVPLSVSDTPGVSFALRTDLGEKKSVGLAVLYSMLLPGMGELYAGSFRSGRYFLGAEGALWLAYTGMSIYSDGMRNDARQFAATHASLSLAGKDDQYFVNVGNFLTIDEYNQQKLRDRTPEKVYDPAAGYSWRWDADGNRALFRDQRIASDRASNNLRFVIAAIVVNHIASAINAARAAIAHNNALADPLGDLQVSADLVGGTTRPQGIMITVARSF